MITLIAALYVVLPAVYALACWALALHTVRFADDAPEAQPAPARAIYTALRDESAHKAISALHTARKQSNAVAAQVWLDVATRYRMKAEAYNAAIVA